MMKHPGRKFYHLFGGLGLLSLYYLLGRQRALICYGLLIAVVLAADITRLRMPAFNQYIQTRFSSFIRKNEANKLTGTAPYVLGIGLTLLLYRTEIATAAICFLAFGDVAATAVGERYGRTKISGEKSLEGTVAFAAIAVTVGFLLPLTGIHLTHGIILAGAIAAAGVELVPLPVNDNLVIPLVSGGVMELIARVTGNA
jgi:glycerol-3-phosphate acyltransferase PlsY